MADKVLQFSTRVDLSGARGGLAELTAAIQSEMADATSSVADASSAISASFSDQAAAATQASSTIADSFSAASEAATSALGDITAAASDSAAAVTDGATASAEAVAASVDIQAASYKQLAAATLEVATARRQVTDAQNAYLAGELPAADAEALLAEAMQRSTAATEQLSLAKGNLAEVTQYLAATSKSEAEAEVLDAEAKMGNAAASEAAAAGEENEATAIRSTMSARMAAGAEIRVLEGNIQGSTRAAAAFLTMIPGIGAALQAAFAVFGAIALIEVLVQVGEAFYKAFDIGGERARKTQSDIADLTRSVEESTEALSVQIDKLQEEDAKLEHVPFNGAKLALDEATLAAYKLTKQLQEANKEEEKILKEEAGSFLSRIFGQTSSTAPERGMVEAHEKNLQSQLTTQGALNESKSYAIALQQRLNQLQRDSSDAALSPVTNQSARNQIAPIEEMIRAQKDEQAQIQATIDLQDEEARHQKLVDAHTAASDASKAARERLQQIKDQFSDLQAASAQLTGHGLTAGEAEGFWRPYLSAFRDKTNEYRAVLDEVVKYQEAIHKQLFEAMVKTNPESAVHLANTPEEHQQAIDAASRASEQSTRDQAALAKATAEMNKELQRQAENLLHSGDRWDGYNSAVAQGSLISIEEKNALQAVNDEIAVSRGLMTQREADTRAAARATTEYNEQLAILNDELRKLQASSKIAHTAMGDVNTDPTNAAAIQKVKNEIAKLSGSHAVTATQDQNKITQDIAKPYLTAFNTIDAGWRKIQSDLIAGNKNIRQDFVQMGVHLVQDSAAAVEKMLADWIRGQILKVAAAQAATAATVAAQATGAAAANSLDQGQKLKDAKAAARGAYKSVVGIPYVGPILAPIAAGVAFAAVEAFEAGGVISGSPGMPVPIVGHAGERVLSAPQTEKFERLVNSPQTGSASSSFHLHYNGSVNAYDRHGMRSTLQAHANDILDIVKQGYNAGSLQRR